MTQKTRRFRSLIPLLLFLETSAIVVTPQLARSQTLWTDRPGAAMGAFEPPPGDGEPDNTAGGGSRGGESCLSQDVTVTLNPVSDELSPSFLIALEPTSAQALAIKIEDENENLLYYDTLAIENSPKTLHFSLPETASALEVGKPYKWTLSAICSGTIDPNDPTIEGLLIPMNIAESLPGAIESVE
ncbi:MAG: DUF928 domain-containing protein [Geitlerinemataceae cyanobacterium]